MMQTCTVMLKIWMKKHELHLSAIQLQSERPVAQYTGMSVRVDANLKRCK